MDNEIIITQEQQDKIELIKSTFIKIKDVIRINNLNSKDYDDLIYEDLQEAEELLIKIIKEQ